MEIEYVTHASLLLRTEALSLLLDPFFYPELDPTLAPGIRHYPDRAFDLAKFGKLDFLFSSHEHNDHCHPETLLRLRAQTETVVIPARRPGLERRFRDAGFKRIVFLQNREPTLLADGLEVTSYWDDPVDSALLIKMSGKSVLHLNDCCLTRGTLARLAKECTVDYVFCGHTSAQELYPLILPKPPAELERLAKAREERFLTGQLTVLDILRPRVVIPYAYTLAYVQPEQIHLNGYSRLTPPRFQEALRVLRPDLECWVLEPGDVFETDTQSLRRYRKESLWGKDLEEFLQNIASYSRSLEGGLPAFDPGETENCAAQLQVHLEKFVASEIPLPNFFHCLDDAFAIHLLGKTGNRSYLVDTRRRVVSELTPEGASARTPLLEINVPASVMQTLLSEVYDALIILSMHRIWFKPHDDLLARGYSPEHEHALYVGTFLALFTDPGHSYLKGYRDLDAYMGQCMSEADFEDQSQNAPQDQR